MLTRSLPRLFQSGRGWLLLVILVGTLPNLIWNVTDQTAWPWDFAWYGKASVDLFFTLLYAPSDWIPAMRQVFGRQAPGIAWAGQFFVPIGLLLGSIDVGLLVSIVVTQAAALLLVARVLWHLSGRLLIAIAGVTMMASAPLFVALSHYYLVETMQTMAVAWFIFIMVRAPAWSRPLIASQLLLATTVAMLAKVSSPLFCFAPGLVTLYYLVRPGQKADRPATRRTVATLVAAIPLGAATAVWYYQNFQAVAGHVALSSTGRVAELYGKSEPFLPSFKYWLSALYVNFFWPLTIVVAATVACAGIIATLASRDVRNKRFLLAAGVAVVQLVVALCVFSLSSNRDDRYALALLPYVALIVCWALARLDRQAVTATVIATFALQWAGVHAYALGVRAMTSVPPWLNVRMTDPRNRAILDALVQRTCTDTGAGVYANAIGVQLLWLNAPGVSYAASKRYTPAHRLTCNYEAVNYYDTDEEAVWRRLIAANPAYYVALSASDYEVPAISAGPTANALNEAILKRIERSGAFQLESGIAEHPKILIFKRVPQIERVAHGRALCDRGNHEQAIVVLNEATTLEPGNTEAWANLALAYERAGHLPQAIAAGNQARRLSPTHYYVHLGLARAFMQQKQWKDALARAEDAVASAPGVPERVSALTYASKAAFASKKANQGCSLLRLAADLQSSPEILAERLKHQCKR